MKRRIYLDYNATTPVCDEALKEYTKLSKLFGNPSSVHETGRKAKAVLENSRESIAAYIGAVPEKLIFTSSGSEGNAQVLTSVLYRFLETKEPAHILVSSIEHSSIRYMALQLQKYGIEVDVIPVTPSGYIDLDAVVSLLKPHTKLVSVMLANNEVGTIQPIAEVVSLVKSHSTALIHTDAVQSLGKMPIDVVALGVDFLTISAHKVYAPKGVGALYVRNDKTLVPLILGSSHERKLRAGTENVAGIGAFAKALDVITPEETITHSVPLMAELRTHLETLNALIHTPSTNVLPTTVSVAFKGMEGHALAMNLDLEGIDVATGSACSSGSIDPSHVLEAMGVDHALNLSTIRVSIGRYTTKDHIDTFIACMTRVLS